MTLVDMVGRFQNVVFDKYRLVLTLFPSPINSALFQLLVQTEGAKPKRLAKPDPTRLRQGGEKEEGGEGGRKAK